MASIKSVQFQCPKCKFQWTIRVPSTTAVTARQRCPSCKKYSENCLKPYNPWASHTK